MEDNGEYNKLMMSIDFARIGKDGVKVKITACGNNIDEFEKNLEYLKGKAFFEMGH